MADNRFFDIEKYSVEFQKEMSAEQMYIVCGTLSAFLDWEEMGYKNRMPLGKLMDFLHYGGERHVLMEDSSIGNIFTVGNSVSFEVVNNFSDFDIPSELADRFGPCLVSRELTLFRDDKEFFIGPVSREHVVPSRQLPQAVTDLIKATQDAFGERNKVCLIGSFHDRDLDNRWLHSVGPAPDEFTLGTEYDIQDGDRLTTRIAYCNLKVADCQSLDLKYVKAALESNLSVLEMAEEHQSEGRRERAEREPVRRHRVPPDERPPREDRKRPGRGIGRH